MTGHHPWSTIKHQAPEIGEADVKVPFLNGEEAVGGAWRSERRRHNTAGEFLLLTHAGSPCVARWQADRLHVDLFEPVDVEDLVLLWLQQQGWLLIPSSRKHDTPMYEAALIHPTSGELAVVSVKSGHSSFVPIPELAEAAGEARAYAYSTHDNYTKPPDAYGVIKIERDKLIAFMREHSELLPPRVARWLAPQKQ
ncbi:MAG: hypothetical protein DLM64_06055 [Solirubrobacterales bacterium]|nr:MAG: hypothetical protein DLM64_06055 [Solirubrobacterales bacterium]